jgi:hypothetical protein
LTIATFKIVLKARLSGRENGGRLTSPFGGSGGGTTTTNMKVGKMTKQLLTGAIGAAIIALGASSRPRDLFSAG